MKRILYLSLAIILFLLLVACSNVTAKETQQMKPTIYTSPLVSKPIEFKPISPTAPIVPTVTTIPEIEMTIDWNMDDAMVFPNLNQLVIDEPSGYASTPFTVRYDDVYQYLTTDTFYSSQYPLVSKSRREAIAYHGDVASIYYTDSIICASHDRSKSLTVTFERDSAQYANYHKLTVSFSGLNNDFEQNSCRGILEVISKSCAEYAMYGKDKDGKEYQFEDNEDQKQENITQLCAFDLSESSYNDDYKYYIVRRFDDVFQEVTFSFGIERKVNIIVKNAPIIIGATLKDLPMELDDIVSEDFGVADPNNTIQFANKMLAQYDEKYYKSVIDKVVIEKLISSECTEYGLYVKFGYFENETVKNNTKFEIATKYTVDQTGNVIRSNFGTVISGIKDHAIDLEDKKEIRMNEFQKIVSVFEKLFAYPNVSKVHYIDRVPTIVNMFYANILGQPYQQRLYVDYIANGTITVRCNRDFVDSF